MFAIRGHMREMSNLPPLHAYCKNASVKDTASSVQFQSQKSTSLIQVIFRICGLRFGDLCNMPLSLTVVSGILVLCNLFHLRLVSSFYVQIVAVAQDS